MPAFALAVIDGLRPKESCYSSMAQMLSTRSVIERLSQDLLNIAELYGAADGDTVVCDVRLDAPFPEDDLQPTLRFLRCRQCPLMLA